MSINNINYQQLSEKIKQWGKTLGFANIGISDIDLTQHESLLQSWLDRGFHGDMEYMANHGMKRARPAEILPGTIRVISVTMEYLPQDAQFAANLADPDAAYISRYALGRDYHKVIRQRLNKLADKIKQHIEQLPQVAELGYRPFVDSAPILERQLADKAGLGWTGKHSLLLNEQGSWFFLGELLVNIPLPIDKPVVEQCGHCVACIKICPTQAIVEPYVVDARRCISYLTIESKGSIPEDLRPLIGNRIYGCDDCQLVCPWNRYAQLTQEADFSPRSQLSQQKLITLFGWSETEFLTFTEGSAIRRIGFARWQRNIAVALGNAPYHDDIVRQLTQHHSDNEMVTEHVLWALEQQQTKQATKEDGQKATAITVIDSVSHSDHHSRLTRRLINTIKKGLPRDA